MYYNKAFTDGDFKDYQRYLVTIQSRLAPELYAFVSDVKRHNLQKESLHDARIVEFSVNTAPEQKPSGQLVLIGPYYDRQFVLEFRSITYYDVSQNFALSPNPPDLLTYEVGFRVIHNKEQFYFLAEFADDNTLEIGCDELDITEKFLQA